MATPSVPTEEVVDLSPFKRMVMTIGTLPNAFTESMTYYEALAYFVKYLDESIVPAINQNADATKELQELFTQLKSYVDTYFDNLDVQDEINNKLDEMAASGQLAEIIAQYLGLASVYGFQTIANMSVATYLYNGAICKILGKTNPRTGDGSFYLVRTRLNSDEPDGVNLVVLTETENLVAEIIPDYFINQLNSSLATTNATVSNIDDRVTNLEQKKHLVIIGDSFSTTRYNPVETAWYTIVGNRLGLTVHNYAQNSAGYVHVGENSSTFLTQGEQAAADTAFDNSDVDMIIVYGGLNDLNTTDYSQIQANAVTLCNQLTQDFPNAKIVIAAFNTFPQGAWVNPNNQNQGARTLLFALKSTLRSKPIIFINTLYWLLTDNQENYSDRDHPNELGNQVTASNFLTTLYGSPLQMLATNQPISTTATTGTGSLNITFNQNTINISGSGTVPAGGDRVLYPIPKGILTGSAITTGIPCIGGVNKMGYLTTSGTNFVLRGEANTSYYPNVTIPIT